MIDLDIWTAALRPVAPLGQYRSCEMTLRHNAISDLTVRVPISSPKAQHMIERGSRITAELSDGDFRTRLFTGRLVSAHATGPSMSGEWEIKYEGDLALLWGMRAYPVPEAPLSDQSAAAECIIAGPLESVVKEFVRRNAGRFRYPPVVVAPSKGRGPQVTIKGRMHTMQEILIPELEKAGMGIWVEQADSALLVDVYQTATYPYGLSELGGTITGFELDVTAPDVTTVIGASNEASVTFLDLNPTHLQEQVWGRRIEGFVESGATEDELRKAADQAFEDGKPTWGVSVDLTASESLRLGRNIWLGDMVSVELSDQDPVVQPLSEVTIRADKGLGDDGLPVWSITPTVGQVSNGSTRLYRTVTRLAQKINRRQ